MRLPGCVGAQLSSGPDLPSPVQVQSTRWLSGIPREVRLGVSAKITGNVRAQFTPDGCGVVARGSFNPGTLNWSEPARGYRSMANVHCSGALCGRFGAPPEGNSKLTQGPYSVQLEPFKFSQEVRGFAMGMTQVNHTDSPSQTTHWVLRGAETKRSCVKKPVCN